MSNNLSKQLRVEKADNLVTYRLIGAGTKDPLTDKPMFRSGYVMPGIATIYDPGDENGNYNKTIRNISGHSTDENNKVVYQIDEVAFDHTNSISVRPQQFALYEFLERHPRNVSNPYHDKTKAPLFERLDFVKMAEEAIAAEDTLFDAVSLARTMDIDDLVDYARSLNVNTDRDAKEIRFDMIRRAKEDPAKFIANSNSITTKTRSRLAIAQEEGVIIYQAASRSWNFKGGDGPFLTVAPGIQSFDALVDFILKSRDGELVLKHIERKLGIEPAEKNILSNAGAPAVTTEVTTNVSKTRTAPAPRKTAKAGTAAKKGAGSKKATKQVEAPAENTTGGTEGNDA